MKAPKYLPLVLAALQTIAAKPGRHFHMDVFHDDDCSLFVGGGCDCEPTVGPPVPVPERWS